MPKIMFLKNRVHNTNDISDKLLKKLEQNEQYRQNKMQINCIKQVLVKHDYVPEILLDWLIQATEENVKLECETLYKK